MTSAAPGAPGDGEQQTPTHATPLHVFFGSNFGTAEETAHFIAEEARRRGFVPALADLDDAAEQLPVGGAVVVVTATYNGTPPDNATQFATAIDTSALHADGVRYAVFGCGNSEWHRTFQDFPRAVDTALDAGGGQRILDRGEGDAAADFDESLQSWLEQLWPALAQACGLAADTVIASTDASARLSLTIVERTPPSPLAAGRAAVPMPVTETRTLTDDGVAVPVKPVRHLELELPAGVTYAAGDHLGVIPRNSSELIGRVARRFGLDLDDVAVLETRSEETTFLPIGTRIGLRELLTDYVELQAVATRRHVEVLLARTSYPWTRTALESLLGDSDRFRAQVIEQRRSVLDLLEEHPACEVSFAEYVDMLGPLIPRYYSIASSPLLNPQRCAITVGVVQEAARSNGTRNFSGVCSNFLAARETGDTVYAFVRDTSSTFRLPDDPTTPIVLIGAGTGIAPFRGFIQERIGLAARGVSLGQAVLLVGARHPQGDLLYAEELRAAHQQGVVRVEHAFSRLPDAPKVYVQDRVRDLAETVLPLIEADAHVYVCGASVMADGVAEALAAAYSQRNEIDTAAGQDWFTKLAASPRYHVDVWATG